MLPTELEAAEVDQQGKKVARENRRRLQLAIRSLAVREVRNNHAWVHGEPPMVGTGARIPVINDNFAETGD